MVNENESGLLKDLEFTLDNLIDGKFSYSHDRIDNNARSHLKSFLLSSGKRWVISILPTVPTYMVMRENLK